jgi:hypothetical protein
VHSPLSPFAQGWLLGLLLGVTGELALQILMTYFKK